MKRFWGLVLLLTTLSASSFAQHSIQGKVLDKKTEGTIEMATIRLLNSKDSTLVQGCQTDLKGGFSLPRVKEGNYILEVRFLGYEKAFRNLTMTDKALILKNIYLEENDKTLKEVEVRGMTAQMAVKGDTIEYNSAAFKTPENAVVEDLLKKLPGVVIDTDGKITVNGEEVKKIRVDGKKFFSDDIQMTTKNLPVDMVDKVQVVDQKSEMSQLTGFEDDNTERIINITIKANRKKGIFGNMTAGAGADKDGELRYDANAFVNILNGNAQTAVVAGANNTNNQRSGRGRGGMTGSNGIMETQNIGINNNTELSKTLKIGGDGSYNHTNNHTESSTERESWLSGVTYDNNSESKSDRDNHQANMRLEMEWNVDSLTTLIVQPSVSYTKSFSDGNSHYEYFSDGNEISSGKSFNNNESNASNADINLILNRKSNTKKGRTMTFNVGGSLSNSDGEGKNYSDKYTTTDTTIIDQRTTSNSKSYGANFRLSYVEPLWNLKNFLETAVSASLSTRNADKFQYDKDANGLYNALDSTYSNSFENNFYTEVLELNFRHQEKDYNYMLGMKGTPSQTYSTTIYKDAGTIERENEVFNWAPSAQFRYNFGRKKFARLDYRGRTSQPSIEQMQPVRNNNNLMNETIGNPSLNPAFEHTLRLMYSSFNAAKYSSFSAGINGTYTQNALVTNSIYDSTGKQFSQTVNSGKAPFSANANIMFNTPIIKNRLQFNTRTEAGYQERFGYSSRNGTYDEINSTLTLGDLSQNQKRDCQPKSITDFYHRCH